MRETTLNDLFVRDLDQIPLPPRAQWVRRRADVVRAERPRRPSFAFATAIVALLIVAIIVGLQTPAGREVLDRLREGLTQPDTYDYVSVRGALINMEAIEVTRPTSQQLLETSARYVESALARAGKDATLRRPEYSGRVTQDFEAFRAVLREVSRRADIAPTELEDLAIEGLASYGAPCNSQYRSNAVTAAAERAERGFEGTIGITWQQSSPHTDELLGISYVRPGSPAERAGIRVGDRIHSINGRSMAYLQSPQALGSHMRGNPGSTVRLRIVRDGREIDVVVERAVLPAPRFEARLVGGSFAYLDLRHATDLVEVRRSIEALEADARGWILDLRTELGAGDQIAAFLARTLAPSATVWVRTIDREGRTIDQLTDRQAPRIEPRPVVALVDGFTQLTALGLATGLREHGAARLIGEPTSDCAMAVTTVRLASGTLIVRDSWAFTAVQRRDLRDGTLPDQVVARGVEGSDSQLEAAIAWLRTQAR